MLVFRKAQNITSCDQNNMLSNSISCANQYNSTVQVTVQNNSNKEYLNIIGLKSFLSNFKAVFNIKRVHSVYFISYESYF